MLRSKIATEIFLILASFFIAVAVWLIAKQSDIETQIVSARVVVEGDIKQDNIEVNVTPETINVSVQYPQTYSHLINPDAFKIYVKGVNENLAGVEDFRINTMPITIRNIETTNLPESVRPTALGQEFVQVGVKLYTRKAEISAKTKGKPAENYELIQSPPRAKPSEVLLTGSPDSLEKAFDEEKGVIPLETEPVDIEGKKENFFVDASVRLPQGLRYVREERMRVQIDNALTVRAHVVIGEREITKTIENIPIIIRTFSKNLKPVYSPKTASVTVKAPVSLLRKFDREAFMFIPRQPLEETEGYQAEIAIDARFSDQIPPAVREKSSIESYSPESIKIEIVRDEEEETTEPENDSAETTAPEIQSEGEQQK